jgi:Trk K+ transport system NAD-binding subunit
MRAFGTPTVVDPFDRFGEHLGLGIRSPASYQLITWLESGPGAELPTRGHPPADGRWVVCGYGRFGRELVADLHREGIEVTVIEASPDRDEDAPGGVLGDGADPDVLERAGVADAAGFVAGVDNDASNLSMIAAVRRLNPDVFVAARQNRPSSSALFAAMETDALLVPPELVAHEVYAQLSTPLLWRFVQEAPHRGDEWAAGVVDRLVALTGKRRLPPLWKICLNPGEAPALQDWLRAGEARLGEVLRDPDDRDQRLPALVLMVLRDDECLLAPDDDLVLRVGDELLLAGPPAARRGLDATMLVVGAASYVRTGKRVATGWLWRKFQR